MKQTCEFRLGGEIIRRRPGLRPSSDRPLWSAVAVVTTFCIFLTLCSSISAETIAGVVINGTTGKAATRDEVVLIRLGHGMQELAHTRTDGRGHFSFQLPDAGPYLIRAIHQGVTYHRLTSPGTNSVELQVFDVSRTVEGVNVIADVMRFQAQGNDLQATRLFVVNNASNPPRTQMHGDNFQFFLPDGAQIDQGMAMTSGDQPINSSPVPEKAKNYYGFEFPLRPGETQFQVFFHMAYSGELSIDLKATYGAQHFVVMVPKSMSLVSSPGIIFQAMEDPRQPDALVRVMSNTRAGQPFNFRISGTGALNDPGDDSLGPPHPIESETVAPPGRDARKTRGLSLAVDTLDFVGRYRWYILGGVLVLLCGGAFYFMRRSRYTTFADSGHSEPEASGRAFAATKPSSPSNLPFDDLKDKLFQLEIDRQQGRISQPEYQRARTVLDRTLDRAIKRAARK
jgi:hypothetical protein